MTLRGIRPHLITCTRALWKTVWILLAVEGQKPLSRPVAIEALHVKRCELLQLDVGADEVGVPVEGGLPHRPANGVPERASRYSSAVMFSSS